MNKISKLLIAALIIIATSVAVSPYLDNYIRSSGILSFLVKKRVYVERFEKEWVNTEYHNESEVQDIMKFAPKFVAQRDAIKAKYVANVDKYLDWEFSLFSDYKKLYGAFEDGEKYVAKKQLEILGDGISKEELTAYEAAHEQYFEKLKNGSIVMAKHKVKEFVKGMKEVAISEDRIQKMVTLGMVNMMHSTVKKGMFYAKQGLNFAGAAGGGAAGKASAKMIAKAVSKQAAKAGAKQAAKEATGVGSGAAAGAAAGMAVGSAVAPGVGTAVGGTAGTVIGAVVGWVGIDYGMTKAEEMYCRSHIKKLLLHDIDMYFWLPGEPEPVSPTEKEEDQSKVKEFICS